LLGFPDNDDVNFTDSKTFRTLLVAIRPHSGGFDFQSFLLVFYSNHSYEYTVSDLWDR